MLPMDSKLLSNLRPKTTEEILERLEELIHRHRRRYIKKHLRPCPINCDMAIERGRVVVGCAGCQSRNVEVCEKNSEFVSLYTKDELYEDFQEDLRDPEILVRNYRDIATLLWVLGAGEHEEKT